MITNMNSLQMTVINLLRSRLEQKRRTRPPRAVYFFFSSLNLVARHFLFVPHLFRKEKKKRLKKKRNKEKQSHFVSHSFAHDRDATIYA